MHGAEIERSVIGIRSRIGARRRSIRNSLYRRRPYETLEEMRGDGGARRAPVGIGQDSVIVNAIIDKNARVVGACASSTKPASGDATATATSSAKAS